MNAGYRKLLEGETNAWLNERDIPFEAILQPRYVRERRELVNHLYEGSLRPRVKEIAEVLGATRRLVENDRRRLTRPC